MVAASPLPAERLWHSREWIDYVKKCVRGFRHRSLSTALNEHDWDDIAQTAIIHIWKKRAQYCTDSPLKPWLKVVTLHQIQNQLRARFAGKGRRQMAAQLKWHFRNPRPFLTRTVWPDAMQEEVRLEPDMIDPRTVPHENVTLDDFAGLGRREKVTLKLLSSHRNPAAVARHLNGGKKVKRGASGQQRLYREREMLRGLYRKALNQPR